MSRHTWLRPLTLVAALSLAATACGGGGAPAGGGGQDQGGQGGGAQGDGVLKLGYVLPETGQLAYLGPPQIQAAKFAVDKINQAGGVLGKDIPTMVSGDGAAPKTQVAVNSAERVINANVDALIGAASSAISLAIIDKVTGAQVVQCSGSNTAPTFTDYPDDGYYFRTAPSDAIQGPVLADTIISDGHTKVAIAARAGDYGKGLANATAASLKEAGASVAVNASYDPKAQTFDAVVQKLVNSDPDAVVIISYEEGKQILRGLIEAGMGPDQIGIYGVDGLRSEELPELVAPNDPGVLAPMKGTAPASSTNEQFIKSLKEFAPDLKETQFAPQVFDCVTIVGLAAQAAGSDDPTKFKEKMVDVTKEGTECTSFAECKKALEAGDDIDYDGKTGPLDFISAGEPGKADISVYSYNQNGDLKTVDTVTGELPQ